MPTYDYECDNCGHEFELFQRISEDAIKKCPECKKNKLRRLFGTGAAIVFKGSGFYQTDYRSDSYTKGAEKERKATEPKGDGAKSDKKSGDSKSSSGDSKPAPSSGSQGSSGKPSSGNSE